MARVLPAVVLLAPALALGLPGRAATSENGPWLNALTTAYVLVDLQTGDLDGDGAQETVVCYRESLDNTDSLAGVAIFKTKGADGPQPVFHVQLEAACEKVRINGRKLGMLLRSKSDEQKQLVWTYGEEIHFKGDAKATFAGAATRASSAAAGNAAAAAFDGDLTTSWSEGVNGTGIGQTWTIRFPRPTDVGALAIFAGDGNGKRGFNDHNRVHRGSLEAKTEADLGDTAAGVDFSKLGIDSIGDRIDVDFENHPQVKYIPLHKKGVVELQFRIDSVFLGDKKDDTHIAEIEVVPMLTMAQTLDAATSLKNVAKETPSSTPAPKKTAAPAPRKVDEKTDESVKALDSSGRSLINDDE